MRYVYLVFAVVLLLASCTTAPITDTESTQNPNAETAQNGDLVAVDYVGTLTDGTVFDESTQQPLEFVIGQGRLLPEFEQAVLGMSEGEQKTFTIAAENAYGQRINQTQTVPISEFGNQTPQLGMAIAIMDEETQQPRVATISEITDETVTLDLNHPLAGQDLTFEIELVSIQEQPTQAQGTQ